MLFAHSPLLGPSSWEPAGRAARRRGRRVCIADATAIAEASTSFSATFVDAAMACVDDTDDPIVVVGHSGAGVYLPQIGDRLGSRRAALVFVDAPLPPPSGEHRTDSAMGILLDRHTVDGLLRPWLDWWPPDVVERLVPDSAQRRALRSDMPRLPRALYEEPVAVPPEWSTWPCGYVLLSDAYRAEADEASRRGWPVAEADAHHLAIVTDPPSVLDAIGSVVRRL